MIIRRSPLEQIAELLHAGRVDRHLPRFRVEILSERLIDILFQGTVLFYEVLQSILTDATEADTINADLLAFIKS